jgi:hypothetical protein
MEQHESSARFPFRIPKLYFADINRDTTNYVLIVERIPFGKRGKIVNGKVEKLPRKSYEILPVCVKYQDTGSRAWVIWVGFATGVWLWRGLHVNLNVNIS